MASNSSPKSPQVPSFEGEDPRAVLDGPPGDIIVPMRPRAVWSGVDLEPQPWSKNPQVFVSLLLRPSRCKRKQFECVAILSYSENSGKTLIAGIPPWGLGGKQGFLVRPLNEE